MSDNYKIILQKDVPERMAISGYGLKRLKNTRSLSDIKNIFEDRTHIKPQGFWYSLKWYWIANLNEGYDYWNIDYSIDDNRKYFVTDRGFLYDITIDDNKFVHLGDKKNINKIIQIRNYEDMLDFFGEYKHSDSTDRHEIIDWKKVYMDYGGIELAVIKHQSYFDQEKRRWWLNWDVASGCVWNSDVVQKIKWIL